MAARPKPPTDIVRVEVRLSPDIHRRLKAIAERNYRSMHAEIMVAVEKHLKEEEEKT